MTAASDEPPAGGSAPSPEPRYDGPGCWVVLGVPVLTEIIVVAALVSLDHPYRPTVDRMLRTPFGVMSLSCTGLFVVCVVMIVVLSWYERRAARRRALGSPPKEEPPA